MKVYIGPYTGSIRSRIHDKYMTNKYGYDWPETQTTFENLLEKVERIINTVCYKVVDKMFEGKRAVKVKIDNYDLWNADHTIALVVHPILVAMRGEKQGSPYIDDEDVPEHLRSTDAPPKKDEWDLDDNHEARWTYVLDEMIWAFEQCTKDDYGDSQFYSGEVDWKFNKDEETGLTRMERGPSHTFTVDKERKKAHYDRIKNGHRLFGKYYMSLWT